MGRLNQRIYIFCGVMVFLAAVINLMPKPNRSGISEAQLEEITPENVGGKLYDQRDGRATYRMDKMTYDVLAPLGIVARQWNLDGDMYDAVVIASRSKDSFHDPNICFSAQKWLIEKREADVVKTETRGDIPVTIVSMQNEKTRRQMAAYLYKGPGGFYANPNRLKLAYLMEEMTLGDKLDGVFYRFIPYFENQQLSDQEQKAKLKKFIAEYLDEANRQSNGFL